MKTTAVGVSKTTSKFISTAQAPSADDSRITFVKASNGFCPFQVLAAFAVLQIVAFEKADCAAAADRTLQATPSSHSLLPFTFKRMTSMTALENMSVTTVLTSSHRRRGLVTNRFPPPGSGSDWLITL